MQTGYTDTQLDPKEGLRIIADALARTTERFRRNGQCFLIWGWAIAAASMLMWCTQRFTHFAYPFLPFPVAVAIAGAYTLRVWLRGEGTESYTEHFLVRLWAVLALAFIVAVSTRVALGEQPFPMTVFIAGIGTLISGLVMRSRSLQAGGVILFIMAAIMPFLPMDSWALVHGLAVITGYLVPGYLFKYTNRAGA